jgi:phosphoribosylformylglycinamidine synthase
MSHNRRVLIFHAPGVNRDGDLARAFQEAGGDPCILPLSQVQAGAINGQDFALLALPGGFSYGDALGAGRLWALDLQTWLADFLQRFVSSGRPVIGICNGFQALVKSGILPGAGRRATLTYNASGQFECRWVSLIPNPANTSGWLRGLSPVDCPVAHGEGRFQLDSGASLAGSQIAFSYAGKDGQQANGAYPFNPNGSTGDIAGITNLEGNVLGLMPHPEDHIFPYQHPLWKRGGMRGLGLDLFRNGLNAV